MTTKIKCKLLYHSVSPHLQQLYTGFFLLHKQGLIDLEQQLVRVDPSDVSKPQHLKDAQHAHLDVLINDSLRLHYDTHDATEIDEDFLAHCDFYFKRSFSKNYISSLSSHRDRLFPLGLNYFLLPNEFDPFAVQRTWHLKKSLTGWLTSLVSNLDTKDILKDRPRQRQLESLPDFDCPPKVLFLVTAYDPYDNAERSDEKIADRVYINETRAQCIKLLRQELGDKFLGGFNHTRFTKQNYKDYLVLNNEITHKNNYLNILKSHPICIASTGLHGSIGWKMAEYVSHSKAIISEKLNYELPGNFEEGRNYLEFISPEECVEQAVKLISDHSLRKELMKNNSLYYQAYLKPDRLVLNSLLTALIAS